MLYVSTQTMCYTGNPIERAPSFYRIISDLLNTILILREKSCLIITQKNIVVSSPFFSIFFQLAICHRYLMIFSEKL